MSKRGVILEACNSGSAGIHSHSLKVPCSTPEGEGRKLHAVLRDTEPGDRFLLVPLTTVCPACGQKEHLTRDEVLAALHG